MPGWNKVYTVLTIQDTEFELVTDIRDSFVTSNNLTITTGDVGILSNVLRITDNRIAEITMRLITFSWKKEIARQTHILPQKT